MSSLQRSQAKERAKAQKAATYKAGKKTGKLANAGQRPPMSPLLKEARKVQASRRFSQNFLVDEGILDGLVRCLDLQPTDAVLEIGPGLGFLTEKLLQAAVSVTAVELDKRLVEYLETKFKTASPLNLISQDILHYDFSRHQEGTPLKIVGNLPYNITTPILLKLVGEIDNQPELPLTQVQQITVMVQREVAERMAAKPGSKVYGPLSIAMQYRYQVETEFLIPPSAFHPRPKVTSAVVSLLPRPEPLVALEDRRLFRTIVKTAFGQRRKMLKNTLSSGFQWPPGVLEAALQETGIDPNCRAETLSIPTLGHLSNVVSQRLRQS